MNTLKLFRYVAIIEATSFLALLVATYVKYQHDSPGGVEILGPIHGALFIAYVLVALYARTVAGWNAWTTALVLIGAVVPFGGYVVDWRILREQRAT